MNVCRLRDQVCNPCRVAIFAKTSNATPGSLNGPSLLGISWWNENNRQFELHIELAAVSDANVPARNGKRSVALYFGQEFRRVPALARRLVVSGQSNVARHHVRSRFEIPVDGTQSEAIAADLFDRHLGGVIAVDFTAPAYRKVD